MADSEVYRKINAIEKRLEHLNAKEYQAPDRIVRVKQYGAIGDGAANDAAPIQAALDYAATFASTGNAAIVALTPGRIYRVGAKIKMPDNVILDGNYSVVKNGLAGNAIDAIIENYDTTSGNSGIQIRNLTIDGNADEYQSNYYTTATDSTLDSDPTFSGIHLVKCNDTLIDNVFIKNVYSFETDNHGALVLHFCNYCTVSNVRITHCKQDELRFICCEDCVATNCVIHNNGGTGISVSGQISPLVFSYRCIIADCNVYKSGDSTATALAFTGISVNGPDCIVANCISRYNTGSGFTIGHNSAASGAHESRAIGCFAEYNTLDGFDTFGSNGVIFEACNSKYNSRYGWYMYVDAANTYLYNCKASYNNNEGIKLSSSGQPAFSIYGGEFNNNGGNGIYTDSISNIKIVDAYVHDNTSHGIQASNAVGIIIMNCDIDVNSIGIYIHGFTYLNIANNRCVGNSNGIYIDNCSHVIVNGNECSDNGTSGILIASSSSAINDICLSNNACYDSGVGSQDYGIWLGGTTGIADIFMSDNYLHDNVTENFHQTITANISNLNRTSFDAVNKYRITDSGVAYSRHGYSGNHTIALNERVISVTSTSAARTMTLPDNTTAGAGREYVVQDESGGAATHNITIAVAGSDTINGGASVIINTNYGRKTISGNGSGKWFAF